MLISEYLQSRNVSVTTGKVNGFPNHATESAKNKVNLPENSEFAQLLKTQLAEINSAEKNVQFSKHAVERIYERQIDLYDNDTLDRLNKAVELAVQKGSNDALVMIDSNAFLVSVRNNKVITTMATEDMQGSIFTNIDSTVIM